MHIWHHLTSIRVVPGWPSKNHADWLFPALHRRTGVRFLPREGDLYPLQGDIWGRVETSALDQGSNTAYLKIRVTRSDFDALEHAPGWIHNPGMGPSIG